MASEAFDQVSGALGFFDTTVGVIGQISDLMFPGPDPESLNNFRVHVGLVQPDDEKGDERSTGGHAPALAAWDASGNFLNQITPDGPTQQKIAAGGFRDYGIEGRQGADYLSVVRTGPDGVCIHLISGVAAGTGRKSMWTGDIGKMCGAPWYHQNNPITDGDNPYTPDCVWLDGNGDEGHIWKGFNYHLGSFPGTNTDDDDVAHTQNLTAEAWNKDKNLLCKSEPRFSLYEDVEIGYSIRTYRDRPSEGGDPGTPGYADLVLNEAKNWLWGDTPPVGSLPPSLNGKTPKITCLDDETCRPQGPSWNRDVPIQSETRRKMLHRRLANDEVIKQIKRRQVVHADRLIISKIPSHSAVELCESSYSLGPDMVSWTEGMFCDMSEKQLWPICTVSSASYCFDMDTQTVNGPIDSVSTVGTPPYPNSTSGTVTPGVAVVLPASNIATAASAGVPSKSYTTVDTWDP